MDKHLGVADKRIEQLNVYKTVIDHIVSKHGWTDSPSAEEFIKRYDTDFKSLEDSKNAFSPAIASNDLIAGAITTLREEKDTLQQEIAKFEDKMAKLNAKHPDQLAAQLADEVAQKLALARDKAAKVRELTDATNELGKAKDDVSTANAEKQRALDRLLHRDNELKDGIKRYDDLHAEYQRELAKHASSSGARLAPPPSDSSGTVELNDTVSRLLGELQLLTRKPGDSSVDEKIKQIAAAIDKAFDATTRKSVKVELLRLIVRHFSVSSHSSSILSDLDLMRKTFASSDGV
jgi:chromosome segregation ATPase